MAGDLAVGEHVCVESLGGPVGRDGVEDCLVEDVVVAESGIFTTVRGLVDSNCVDTGLVWVVERT